MTHLRKMMLDELERRNYTETTTRAYIRTIADFARYFQRQPDQLGPEQIREYTAHLFRDRKISGSRAESGVHSGTGPRLSIIFFAVSSETLERKTTRELQVPFLAGTMVLNAFVSAEFRAILSW